MPDAPLPRRAGLRRRLGAMLYDAMLIFAIWLITLFIGVALHHGVAVVGHWMPWVQSILFIELFSFFAYFWVWRGQTIGMLAWGLRVESADGTPMRLAQALLRFIGAMLSFATLGIGYLWIYVDPDHRAWPDMLSGTLVVYRPRG